MEVGNKVVHCNYYDYYYYYYYYYYYQLGGLATMKHEHEAATESIANGLYIIWIPNNSCHLTSDAFEGIDNNNN